MKLNFQKIITMIGIVLCTLAVSVAGYRFSVKDEQVEKNIEQVEKPESVAVTVTPKNTIGTLTMYDEYGNVYYQYYGDIDVKSSGWNGQEVDIVINLPSTDGCSCFDEEGQLK